MNRLNLCNVINHFLIVIKVINERLFLIDSLTFFLFFEAASLLLEVRCLKQFNLIFEIGDYLLLLKAYPYFLLLRAL